MQILRGVKCCSSCLYVDERIDVDYCFNFRIITVFEKLLPVVSKISYGQGTQSLMRILHEMGYDWAIVQCERTVLILRS